MNQNGTYTHDMYTPIFISDNGKVEKVLGYDHATKLVVRIEMVHWSPVFQATLYMCYPEPPLKEPYYQTKNNLTLSIDARTRDTNKL